MSDKKKSKAAISGARSPRKTSGAGQAMMISPPMTQTTRSSFSTVLPPMPMPTNVPPVPVRPVMPMPSESQRAKNEMNAANYNMPSVGATGGNSMWSPGLSEPRRAPSVEAREHSPSRPWVSNINTSLPPPNSRAGEQGPTSAPVQQLESPTATQVPFTSRADFIQRRPSAAASSISVSSSVASVTAHQRSPITSSNDSLSSKQPRSDADGLHHKYGSVSTVATSHDGSLHVSEDTAGSSSRMSTFVELEASFAKIMSSHQDKPVELPLSPASATFSSRSIQSVLTNASHATVREEKGVTMPTESDMHVSAANAKSEPTSPPANMASVRITLMGKDLEDQDDPSQSKHPPIPNGQPASPRSISSRSLNPRKSRPDAPLLPSAAREEEIRKRQIVVRTCQETADCKSLPQDELQKLLKEEVILRARVQFLTDAHSRESKIRDGAASLLALHRGKKRAERIAQDEYRAAAEKVENVLQDLWRLTGRLGEVRVQILRHQTGILREGYIRLEGHNRRMSTAREQTRQSRVSMYMNRISLAGELGKVLKAEDMDKRIIELEELLSETNEALAAAKIEAQEARKQVIDERNEGSEWRRKLERLEAAVASVSAVDATQESHKQDISPSDSEFFIQKLEKLREDIRSYQERMGTLEVALASKKAKEAAEAQTPADKHPDVDSRDYGTSEDEGLVGVGKDALLNALALRRYARRDIKRQWTEISQELDELKKSRAEIIQIMEDIFWQVEGAVHPADAATNAPREFSFSGLISGISQLIDAVKYDPGNASIIDPNASQVSAASSRVGDRKELAKMFTPFPTGSSGPALGPAAGARAADDSYTEEDSKVYDQEDVRKRPAPPKLALSVPGQEHRLSTSSAGSTLSPRTPQAAKLLRDMWHLHRDQQNARAVADTSSFISRDDDAFSDLSFDVAAQYAATGAEDAGMLTALLIQQNRYSAEIPRSPVATRTMEFTQEVSNVTSAPVMLEHEDHGYHEEWDEDYGEEDYGEEDYGAEDYVVDYDDEYEAEEVESHMSTYDPLAGYL